MWRNVKLLLYCLFTSMNMVHFIIQLAVILLHLFLDTLCIYFSHCLLQVYRIPMIYFCWAFIWQPSWIFINSNSLLNFWIFFSSGQLYLIRAIISQKEKDKYHILSFICGILKMIQMSLLTKQKQTHRHRKQM